jgi:filamentous hemagglutinin
MALKPLNSVGGFSVGEIPANVILANADITANKATFNGNVAISNVNPAYGLLTDNLYYSNGQPWDLQQAAGNTGEVQFNNGDDFAASANFVWDNTNSNLNITGNANISGTIIAGEIQVDEIKNGTSNIAIPSTSGNVNISVGGTPNVLVTTATGVNVAGTFNTGTGNANVGNLGTDTAIITTGNITTINSGLLQNGTTNVTLTPSGNVATYVAGNATAQFIVTATGINAAGYANILGNANIGNIGTGEISATGNITGANLMGPLANGTSNVSIPAVNGNVNTSVGGVANVLVVTATGANVTGTLNATGNANVGNLGTAGLIVATGNIDGGNLNTIGVVAATGNVSGGNLTTIGVVSATGNVSGGNITTVGEVAATGNVSGGNLTTVGVVSATGNVSGGNLTTVGEVAATGNVSGGNITTVGVVTATGNVSGGNLTTAGALSVTGNANTGNLGTATAVITTGNITTINSGLLQNGGTNVTLTNNGNVSTFVGGNATAQMVVTGTGVNVAGTLNAVANANLGNLGTAQITTTGNISISNATATNGLLTDNLYYANGQPWDIGGIPGGANTAVQYNLNGEFAGSAAFTWDEVANVLDINGNIDVSSTAIVQGNVQTPGINSVGNLTVTTDLGVANNQFVFSNTGNIVMPGNAMIINNSGNISIKSGAAAKYAELLSFDANTAVWVEDSPDGAFIGANLTGTPVTWNFKTNGDLVTNPGNITIGANGNIVATTFIGDLEGNVDTNISNTFVLFSDDGQITGASGFTFDKISNLVTMVGNLNLGPSGENQVINLSNTALEIRGGWNSNAGAVNIVAGDYSNSTLWGKLSIQGNVSGNSVGYSEANVFVFTTPGAGAGNVVRVDTLNTAAANTTSGALQVAGGLGVTGNGYFGNLSVTGDIANANNISVTNTLTAVTGNFSGNITSLNANLGNLVDANIIRTGQLYNGNSNIALTANGNILFSVEGLANVHKFSNVGVNVVGYVQANGNASFGGVETISVTSNVGNLLLQSQQSGNSYVQLRAFGDGTIDVGSARISSLATPTASSDAATKQYVDDVAQGLHVHAPCYTATANTLAIRTGGTITYNNGTAGVGANLVLSGSPTANYLSANCFDANTTAVVGSRILVYKESNSAHNGIYVVDSATVLTRATDFDTPTEMAGGDFTFVQNGDTFNDTGWVMTDPVTTVGTSPVIFVQFSGAGTYQAGAGLTLTGTVFSVNVDNVTTEISGGNVIVKASAQLTTPNIGAATGTSLDLTGNALVNNLNSNLKVTTTDLEATGNIIAANISANANLIVNNANVNLALNGNTANFTGNVILPNLTVNLELAGNTANFTGNLIAANIHANGLANVGNLNVVSNVTSDLLPSANLTYDLGASAQRWDNVYAGNLDASGNFTVAGSFSANTLTGNVLHANNQVEIGNTKIVHGQITTTTTSANQTIASFTQSGITGVEYLVKGMDATGSKYTVATVVAVTDGANVDYSTFATVIIGGTTGTLAVNINGSNIDLQVTPSSSNSTVWVTQYRTI